MVGGKTKSGFEYEVNADLLNDWDFVEMLDSLRNEPEKATMKDATKIYVTLLGEDGFKALKDHVREQNNGIAVIDKINGELAEIVANVKVKN